MANGFQGSPEVGGRDRDRKAPAEEGGQGRRRNDDPDKEGDNTSVPAGLLSEEGGASTSAPLGLSDSALEAIETASLSGPAAQTRESPDHEFFGTPAPEEEEPVLLPGNPSNMGARAARRRKEDDDTPSPILRRGLLGV